VVREFVAGGDGLPGRGNDSVSLTVFAGYAETVCPPTLDHDLLLETLDAVPIVSSQYEDGTSIGQGLAVALGRLQDAPATSRVAILLTDGMNNDSETDPMEVAKLAKELDVRVYTVAMGTSGLAPFPQRDERGNVHWVQMPTEVDEALLTRIAELTGGSFHRAGTTESLRDVYARIDELERSEIEGLTYRSWRELFAWPLAAGAALFLASLLLEGTVFRRLGAGLARGTL
jgi:Ca-activated chloride channel family protein